MDIEMGKGEHKKGGKYPTPNQKVPMMVLPDGTQLGESVAICRFIEETHGENGLLFGREPLERALIEMWQRRVELELLSGAVGKAWINGPVLEGLRAARGLEGHDSELQLGLGAAQSFYREMDEVLSGRPYLAGDSFSIADITLLCVLDFVGLRSPAAHHHGHCSESQRRSCVGRVRGRCACRRDGRSCRASRRGTSA